MTISCLLIARFDAVGQVVAGWRLNEWIHGYVSEAVSAGRCDGVMPGTNWVSITEMTL